MAKLDFIRTFYNTIHTPDSLIKGIDQMLNMGEMGRIFAFPCFIGESFISKLREGYYSAIREHYSESSLTLFEHRYYETNSGEKKHLKERFYLIKNEKYENIYCVISIDNSSYFRTALLHFFQRQYPEVSFTFVTHKRLYNLLLDYKEINRISKIIVTGTSMKSYVEGKAIPSVNWPSLDLERVFRWALEEHAWFERLSFTSYKTTIPFNTPLKTSLSRKGILKTNGKFSWAYDRFLRPIQKDINRNVNIFSKRARSENKDRRVRPLNIDFGANIFSDKSENARFIEALKRMKATDVSVLHGNPYLYLSSIDYYDGSVYDIWVVSPNKLTITAQMRSTHQALKRLVNHIFDNFAEGEIEAG